MDTLAPRTFTASEVCAILNLNPETLRTWRRKGYFDVDRSEGWHRYSWSELFNIAVFSEVSQSVGTYDFASSAGSLAAGLLQEMVHDGPAYYIVGSNHSGFKPALEIAVGVDDAVRVIRGFVLSDTNFGCYALVDLASILHRMFARLTDLEGQK